MRSLGAGALLDFSDIFQSVSLKEPASRGVMSSLHEVAENLDTPYDTMLRFVSAVSIKPFGKPMVLL